jgi:transposase
VLSWPSTVKIFLGAEPTDMRKGFDSLAHLVESSMALDPLSGHLFVFRSRRGDRIKVLYWDKDGYALWYKRLEKGSFRFPTTVSASEPQAVEVKAADLMMILDGVDLGSVRRQRRYCREAAENPR